MNFAEVVTRAAAVHPDRPALCADGREVTYAELAGNAARVAGTLAERGVEPGEVVAIRLPNGVDLPACYFGALMAGAAVTTVNTLLRPAEVERLLHDCGARILLGEQPEGMSGDLGVTPVPPEVAMKADALAAPLARTGDDPAVLVYSSGTTGAPKAAEMTHANLDGASRATLEAIGEWGDPPAALCAAPFFQGYGQGTGMNAMLRAGATIFTFARFEASRALATLEEHRIPMLQAVPTMCHDLLELPELRERDVSALRLCLTGGAAMPVDLMRRFEQGFGCEVLEGYGLTEAMRAAMNRPGQRKPGSIGQPLPGVEARILDGDSPAAAGEVGELWIRGPNVMRGYWRNPEATAEVMRDGWLRTRDLAYADQEGYVFVLGRTDDAITRGGYKIYPSEVERVLGEHPAVAEAAVIPVTDERLGSEIGAALVPAAGREVDLDDVSDFARERLAPYKRPRLLWTVSELPRNFTGKLLRREISPPDMLTRS